jgi:uncharacterized membrane protein YeaQ/YmgE (transglycosylase-associated protein family)
MSIIAWIILGGIAGWIASIIMRTDADQGILMNIVVGIVGALLGGFLIQFVGGDGVNGFNLYSLIVATVGAIVLLALVRAVRGSNRV